jgi:hypothetical protein
MRMRAQRVPFVRQKLVEIGFNDNGVSNDNRVGGDVA